MKINILVAIQLIILLNSFVNSRKSSKEKQNKTTDDMEKGMKFMTEEDVKQKKEIYLSAEASWNYKTNISDENSKKNGDASKKYGTFQDKLSKEAQKYNWQSYKSKNETVYRWFKLSIEIKSDADSPDEADLLHRSGKDSMVEVFNKAKMCSFDKSQKECKLKMQPDMEDIFRYSRDPEELKYYWKESRDKTGKEIREKFIEAVKTKNKAAKDKGYADFGAMQMAAYESASLVDDTKEVMKKLLPFYKQIHAYVRKKLKSHYKNVTIKDNGPIPAHLLGNMYAQDWSNIFLIVDPYPQYTAPNVTSAMVKKKLKAIDLFLMAQKFFVSIGMKEMTPHFWHYSVIEQPPDRQIDCHGSAHDFHDGKDFRIKMCTTIDATMFQTVHHEMGHIQYYMHYSHHLFPFQEGANPGFHEAIGDTISLSVNTPSYLIEVGLLQQNETGTDEKYDISYLMNMALQFVTRIPYAYVICFWNNRVYNGTVKTDQLNKNYWEYRLEYQGLCPPVERTEKDFDIGAKFHIANNVEYLRYFFSSVLQFQIHKYLCIEAEDHGPLFKCNIYKNEKAGKLFSKLLSLGQSKQWEDSLGIFTRNKSTKLEAEPVLEYFKPLIDWLKKENKDEHIGWESKNPMECPE